jgi:hypothetical protein
MSWCGSPLTLSIWESDIERISAPLLVVVPLMLAVLPSVRVGHGFDSRSRHPKTMLQMYMKEKTSTCISLKIFRFFSRFLKNGLKTWKLWVQMKVSYPFPNFIEIQKHHLSKNHFRSSIHRWHLSPGSLYGLKYRPLFQNRILGFCNILPTEQCHYQRYLLGLFVNTWQFFVWWHFFR